MAQKNNALATTKGNQSAEHGKKPSDYTVLALLLALLALLAFAGVEGWL